MIVGNLVIEMAMNVARLQTDVEKANALIGNHVKNVEKSMRQVQNLLGSLGIGLSIAGITAAIKSSVDFADRLNDLSKTTNLTVTQLAGLDLAARQSGTDLDGAAKAVDKLSVNMGKNAKAFADLGINSTDKLAAFKQFADVFNNIADVHQRDAFAAAALGKGWETVAPLLAEGGAKIAEMVEKGERLSGITEENVRRADEFNDKLDELAVTFRGLGLAIGNEMFPKLISLNEWFTELGISAIEFSEKTALAWQALVTPSAWFNNKELADLKGRFKAIGKMADEARAMAKAESQPGAGPASPIRKTGKSPDVSGFIDPDEAKKRQKHFDDVLAWETQLAIEKQKIIQTQADDQLAWETELTIEKQKRIQEAADYELQIETDKVLKLYQIKQSSNAELAQLAFQGELDQAALNQLGTDQKIGAMASGFGQILQMAGGHSKSMFEMSKKFALVDAAISMYQGIAKGVALGWPMGIPAVAWATATGIAQIQKIQAQQFGGGVSGGGGSGGGVGAPTGIYGTQGEQSVGVIPTQKQTTAVTINLSDGFYSATAIRNLIEKINEQVRDGASLENIVVSS